MSEQANIDAIRVHIATFGRGDIAGIQQQCTEDVVWSPPMSNGRIVYNRPWQGRDGVGEYCRLLMGTFEWQAFDVPLILAQGDHVVILGKETFTVRATGVKIDNTFLALFRMRDGLIAEFTLCENTELVAAAIAGVAA